MVNRELTKLKRIRVLLWFPPLIRFWLINTLVLPYLVYFESIKREVKITPISECWFDERLKTTCDFIIRVKREQRLKTKAEYLVDETISLVSRFESDFLGKKKKKEKRS